MKFIPCLPIHILLRHGVPCVVLTVAFGMLQLGVERLTIPAETLC